MKTIIDKNGVEIKDGDRVKLFRKIIEPIPKSLIDPELGYIFDYDKEAFDIIKEENDYYFIDIETKQKIVYTDDFEKEVRLFEMPFDVPTFNISKGDMELVFPLEGGCLGLFRYNKEDLERL